MAGWRRGARLIARMKALLADTLFKRLFALMWLALVISHAVAFLVVTRSGIGVGGLPTFPSLPPFSLDAAAPAPDGRGRVRRRRRPAGRWWRRGPAAGPAARWPGRAAPFPGRPPTAAA